MGTFFGLLLSLASRLLKVPVDSLKEDLLEMLPGINCGQCGYPGCSAAADALISNNAPLTLCPPGGSSLITQLSEKLGRSDCISQSAQPQVAFINEDQCIGCAHCGKLCPTDAIMGAPKQIHFVFPQACIGCGACVDVCPTECLQMRSEPITLATWIVPKPAL